MFDFSNVLDLPLIFALIIGFAIFMYVLLDGFDLGVGILFPFAPTNNCRHKMMNSVAPFWDGNETWLVLGGGGLLAAFPVAAAIVFPAFYLPIILMLLGLILRGVAFEFRFKSKDPKEERIWDYSFHCGSVIAAFFQGVMLGAYIQGDAFSEGAFNWFSGFSILCGIALIFGYALLGSTWLVMKTHDETQDWARHVSYYVMIFVAIFILIVSIWTPFLDERIFARWFSKPNFFYFLPLPIFTVLAFLMLLGSLIAKREYLPFMLSFMIFMLCYLGLLISMFPYAVPYELKFSEAAASPKALSLLLIGVAITVPMILIYSLYAYHVFRGKVSNERLY